MENKYRYAFLKKDLTIKLPGGTHIFQNGIHFLIKSFNADNTLDLIDPFGKKYALKKGLFTLVSFNPLIESVYMRYAKEYL